ncbi:MAG: metallophosphoesterase family protein [Clostridia bacterium]|nr:metallophosphoesterase family protein [Clostridia bacterium]
MTKRIILFSDVHGNITGLRAVMEAVDRLENVTHIIGLGDYFGWGAGGDDVVDLCREKGAILIRGGHEEILNIIDRGEDEGSYYPEIYFTHRWLRANLRPENYAYVTSLPTEVRLRLNDRHTLIGFHAALGDMESYTCGSDRPRQVLEDTYGRLLEDIVVYGHYHEPHVIPLAGKLLVNCASVGQRRHDSLSNYTIIEYDEEKIAVIQRQVPYDKAEEDRLVAERGMQRRL